jgi:Invasion associated locus B (IalB) protein
MKYGMFLRSIASVAIFSAISVAAIAQTPESPTSLGKSGDWEAFTYDAADSKVCYVFSAPTKSEPKTAKRNPVYFMITHWPSRKVKSQPSTFIGYTFKDASAVGLSIEGKKFDLYPVGDMAWTDKAETEKAILAAMKSGKSMTIKGTSARGTETTDTYSLAGISSAMDKIDNACK